MNDELNIYYSGVRFTFKANFKKENSNNYIMGRISDTVHIFCGFHFLFFLYDAYSFKFL